MSGALALTEGKIGKLLVRFSLPFLLSSMIQTAYSSVDIFFLGRFASAQAQAGAGNGAALLFTVTGFFLGLTNGGMILLGQYFGARRDRDAAKATGNIAAVLIVSAAAASAIVFLFGRTFLNIMNVPGEAAGEAWDYLRICACGLLFTMGYAAVSSVLRALGNSKAPLVFVSISCGINIVLDYIFVGPLGMGAAGAAAATVIAQCFSLIVSVAFLAIKRLPFRFGLRDIKPDFAVIKSIFRLGLPISLQTVLNMLSFVVIAGIINKLGVPASAANGVVNNLANFYMTVPMAIGTALSAISAQNLGAGKPYRALAAAKMGSLFSLAVAVPCVLFANFRPEAIVSLLSDDPEVIAESARFLIPFSWDCLFVSFVFCLNGFFNGCGITAFVAAHELVAAFAVRIPLSWLLSRAPGATLFHVGIGTPAATAASLAMCLAFYKLRMSGGRLESLKIAYGE
ncbi:MAG: MATE family efflux transporter [Oscillospiraceae bacterium]|jgi:putative MATE family efflux protein|nr:MATE family efflux transporter [Oscillospiraceae bacterium]